MTDDEYQRIKDAEKQRLKAKRTLKHLRQALREQRTSGQHAVARMTERVRSLFEEHRSAVDALQWDTAHLQARLDALRDTLTGAASSADTDAVDSDLADSADALDDEALRRHRAEQLVDDLRTQLDADASHPSADNASNDNATNENAPGDKAPDDTPPDDGLPEKTIGRMPRS